jgi:hypothetical protein
MKTFGFVPTAAAIVCLTCACSESVSDRARVVSGRPLECAEVETWPDELRTLTSGAVREVERHYIVDTCSGTAQVSGIRLLVPRPQGATSERWNRWRRCPSQRVFVTDASPSDSARGHFWIPNGWLDIEVKPSGADLAITLSAESLSKNVQLFRRTAAFMRGQ